MSLGGYIFKGYKFVLPADYDSTVDAQVIAQCLRLHKMKLKAFMESCTATGANWQFSETNGDASFESYGNVIYKLDQDGFNYASFFRYGTDNAYYCMMTVSDASYSSGKALQIYNQYWAYVSSTSYRFQISNNMDSIGIEPITFSNMFSTATNSMYHRLSFSTNHGSVVTTANTLSKALTDNQYFGYATKGKNIISISSHDITSLSATYVKISSIGSLQLASNTDTSNMFSYLTNASDYTAATGNYSEGFLKNQSYIQVSGNNGLPYEYGSHTSGGPSPLVYIRTPYRAICALPNSNIPFEPAVISAMSKRTTNIMNSDGIPTKGAVSVDLLATNLIISNYLTNNMPYVETLRSCGNGNYLCISKTKPNSNSYWIRAGILYCGWDSTNPDIMQESSWPVYSD